MTSKTKNKMLKYVSYDIVFQEIPDEITLAINISNCPNHCKGCHSPALMGDIGEPLTFEVLDKLLTQYGSEITCICFMGGDSSQADIVLLAKYLCFNKISSVSVAWYSGKQELPDDFDKRWFDYIKLGPYIEQLGNLQSKHTNQRMWKKGVLDGWLDITHKFLKDDSKQ